MTAARAIADALASDMGFPTGAGELVHFGTRGDGKRNVGILLARPAVHDSLLASPDPHIEERGLASV